MFFHLKQDLMERVFYYLDSKLEPYDGPRLGYYAEKAYGPLRISLFDTSFCRGLEFVLPKNVWSYPLIELYFDRSLDQWVFIGPGRGWLQHIVYRYRKLTGRCRQCGKHECECGPLPF